MKKRYWILFFIFFLLCGCMKGEKLENRKEIPSEDIIENVPQYQDNNQTPISFYRLKGDKLEKISSITGDFHALDDIGFLQIYPSSEDTIILNTSFASSFYDSWQSYSQSNLKIGFSLKLSVPEKGEFSYNILNPNQTMDHWEYFMAYLYDDYANRGKSFYSHVEANEYTEDTLFTAFKLQCGSNCQDISSPFYLTVFTYDSEDDFLDGVYRGNSQYTIPVCLHGAC
ncbi:MAG: hypothetical protein IJI60_04780 [Bacilli bacterium]|nr:hypothetical protein [Bacilli bacterium]